MNAKEFAKTHSTDNDWVDAMVNHGLDCVVLTPGQKGTYAGFKATVIRHYRNGMYEMRVPGGVSCVDGRDFEPENA